MKGFKLKISNNNIPRIFLCHAKEDSSKVRKISKILKATDFEPWFDEKNLKTGDKWSIEIQNAIKTADFFLVFFSQNSINKRGFVQKEIRIAIEEYQYRSPNIKYILPIKLEPCNIPQIKIDANMFITDLHIREIFDISDDDMINGLLRDIWESWEEINFLIGGKTEKSKQSGETKGIEPRSTKRVIISGKIPSDLSPEVLKSFIIVKLEENKINTRDSPISGFAIDQKENSSNYESVRFYTTENNFLHFDFVNEIVKKRVNPLSSKHELVSEYNVIPCAYDMETNMLIVISANFMNYGIIKSLLESNNKLSVSVEDTNWTTDFIKWLIEYGEDKSPEIKSITGFRVTNLNELFSEIKVKASKPARESFIYQSSHEGRFRSVELVCAIGKSIVTATVWSGSKITLKAQATQDQLFLYYRKVYLVLNELKDLFEKSLD